MKIKKILLLLLPLIGIVLIVIFLSRLFGVNAKILSYPKQYFECFMSKGKLESVPSPGRRPRVCVHYFEDSGKTCTSNEECQGNCLITDDTMFETNSDKSKIILSPKIIGGTGKCEYSDMRGPCYRGDFKNTMGYCI